MAHPPDALQAADGLLQLAEEGGRAPEVLPDSVPQMILDAGRGREAVAAAARLAEGDGAPASVAQALAALGGEAP